MNGEKICAYDSDVRRDDGIRNEFRMMTDAYMTTEMCESDSDFHRDDEKMKCLLGWPSNLWICKELWREMKLKKICAYDSGESRNDELWERGKDLLQ